MLNFRAHRETDIYEMLAPEREKGHAGAYGNEKIV